MFLVFFSANLREFPLSLVSIQTIENAGSNLVCFEPLIPKIIIKKLDIKNSTGI